MNFKNIEKGIVQLIKTAETEIPKDVITALKNALNQEKGIAKIQIETILKNIALAKKTKRPLCQDTGILTFIVLIGTDYPAIGKIKNSIMTAVQNATKEIPLRPNTVDPLTGKNQGENIGNYMPHIIWDFIPGSNVIITALPKGSGSENMSALGMLTPSIGIDGVKEFVVEKVRQAGGKPCPPTIVGVGIGGSADLALTLGKLALLRPVGRHHRDKRIAEIENELKEHINKTGIGPMGLGGKTTVLDVHVEVAHRHPASLPVGVVMQCWADRRATMVLHKDGSWDVK